METSPDNFSLIWEDFQENVSKNFSNMREYRDLSDVTLVCEDNEQVAAHRVVLSSCSSLLLSVLRSLRQPQPLIYFWGGLDSWRPSWTSATGGRLVSTPWSWRTSSGWQKYWALRKLREVTMWRVNVIKAHIKI